MITSSSSRNQTKIAIEFDQLKSLFNNICNEIESITKNEYQFIKHCEEYFNYSLVQEIPLSTADEDPDFGYYVPIDKSLSSILNSQPFTFKILENIREQQLATELDNDLMFSIRNSYYGLRLDDDHLLIQLYLDDIGLTNPLGSKRDQHKLSMVYFTLEDIPDQYKSKLDFIQLIGICDSRILKVKALIKIRIINNSFVNKKFLINLKQNKSIFSNKSYLFGLVEKINLIVSLYVTLNISS